MISSNESIEFKCNNEDLLEVKEDDGVPRGVGAPQNSGLRLATAVVVASPHFSTARSRHSRTFKFPFDAAAKNGIPPVLFLLLTSNADSNCSASRNFSVKYSRHSNQSHPSTTQRGDHPDPFFIVKSAPLEGLS